MSEPQFLSPEIERLRALAACMRELGVVQYKTSAIEILLGPEPRALQTEPERVKSAAELHEEEMRVLLHSSGADVTPFLKVPE